MTASEIYDTYNIMPQLRDHMYRVTAVARIICDALDIGDDEPHIISACLLHDTGNIIKFDLDRPPDSISTHDTEYWREEQRKFKEKYGEDVHGATHAIAKELGVSRRTLELIDAVGYSIACENAAHDDLGKKICAYADMRVAPWGAVSLADRLKDIGERYGKHSGFDIGFAEERNKCLFEIEKQIFSRATIRPEDVTDGAMAPIIKEFEGFEAR